MNALTLAELRLKQAEYAHRAERLSQTWRTLPTGAKALAMGKQVKLLKERADDYFDLIEMVNQHENYKMARRLLAEGAKETP